MVTEVRPARQHEVEALHELAAATFPLACPSHLPAVAIAEFIATHLSVAAFTAHLAEPDHAVLVAEVDGDLRGYALAKLGRPDDPDVLAAVPDGPWCELSKLYVHPDAHGSGLARALLDAVESTARDASAVTLWLGVNALNARANAFYAKQGLEVVGPRRFVVGGQVEEDFVRARPVGA
ncbi:MAG: GNAT family N-acetyltransferase [Aeromicrobium sp.]|uniref:GNAT family N-acetyltransferase n=1 Tax=Aeromicrobium sp. TaxID=1871063 RepID=UPI00262A62B6|nr:GNAT family N-acetyltransferase [Aeromicrobium sp.]MDF1705275.1 GNAT family N-acetyltransferase [Aeromicrobium sp.]